MKRAHPILLAAVTAVMLFAVSAYSSPDTKTLGPADTIYINGKIYTVDEAQPWAEALEIAGITKDTPNPDGGVIEKDPKSGEPTEFLSESGIALVGRHTPRIDVKATKRAMERAFAELRALGITSFIDMWAYTNSMEAYRLIEQEGGLTFRISAAIALNEYTDEFETLEGAAELLTKAKEYDTELLSADSFKYWTDGTPISYTSLLIEPYFQPRY